MPRCLRVLQVDALRLEEGARAAVLLHHLALALRLDDVLPPARVLAFEPHLVEHASSLDFVSQQ